MSEFNNGSRYHSSTNNVAADNDSDFRNCKAEMLAHSLEGWREIIIRFESVLNWEKPYVLGGLIGAITLLFLLIFYFDPPVLTLVGLIGMLAALADFGVPLLALLIFGQQSSNQWGGRQERQLLAICRRIINAKDHLNSFVVWLICMRKDRPVVYFGTVMPTLLGMALLGAYLNNLMLSYLVLVILLLLPGLRHNGLLRKGLAKLAAIVKRKGKIQ